MSKVKYPLLLVLFCVIPMAAQTQGSLGMTQKTLYTLTQCREMALEHNAKLKQEANKRSIASQEKKEAFTNFLPSVSLSGGAMKADEGLIQMPMGEQTMGLVGEGLFGGVTATLPIFAGGQIYNGNKLAKVGLEVSELQLKQTEKEVILTTEQYYWQIVVLCEKLKTLQTVESLLEKIHSDVKMAVDAGIKNRNDYLQVQLRQNDTQSLRMGLENNIDICKMLLAQYIGLTTSDFDVQSVDKEGLQSPEMLSVNHNEALPLTTEYRLLNKGVEAAKLKKRLNLGQFLPTVALGGAYLYNDLMGPSQNSLVGMVTVSVPLSWKTPYSVKKQKLHLQNARIDLSNGSEQLVIRMQKAQNDLWNAYRQVQLAQTSIEQSTENLRLNEAYYKAGTSSMSDLLDAQMYYQQSQDKYAEAYSAYQIKRTEYLQATGR